MTIRPEKLNELQKRMAQLEIKEKDLIESFTTGSGRGGQKMQKSSNVVTLKHLQSGLTVSSQDTRSREDNRFFARRKLCDALEQKKLGRISPEEKKRAKIKKQKMRRRKKTIRRLSSDECSDP